MMNEQPLLAVIVPCYNLEKYIDRCVSSIVGQTYARLDIILIDDGSTDHTGIMCDNWEKRDARIRVIHKSNEGIAYARKTGIENTPAEYVTFVDADDWIAPEMYASMMSALLSTQSDIAQCGYCKVFEDGRMENSHPDIVDGFVEIVGREEGVFLILDDKKWNSFLWNKIFKKHLFEDVEFLKDLNLGEDFISHHLFHKARQSVFLSTDYYFYYQREGSIIRAGSVATRMKHQYQYTQAIYSRFLFVKQHPQYHFMLQEIKERLICEGLMSLRHIVDFPQLFPPDSFEKLVKQIKSVRYTRKTVLWLGFSIDLFLLKIHPEFYKIIRKLYLSILKITKNDPYR